MRCFQVWITVILMCMTGQSTAENTATLTLLHTFTGADGSRPWAGLVQSSDGDFYGTTIIGGDNNAGTVFKITSVGTLTSLHSFVHNKGYVIGPSGTLVQGSNGNLYGTTLQGGTSTNCPVDWGCGTVFTITPTGSLTTLHNFNHINGSVPWDSPIEGSDGNLYGTTHLGGNTELNNGDGAGTIYKLSPSGTLTTLHKFNISDGQYLLGKLVEGSDSNYYGTTSAGGTSTSCLVPEGCGTVFKITPEGTLTTLHNFSGFDGTRPGRSLGKGSDDNFYGSTSYGGTSDQCPILEGCGTVFKITPEGTLSTLHNFNGFDGYEPSGSLLQGSDGSFYGTSLRGGPLNRGTVFKISADRELTTLHHAVDTSPNPELLQGIDGNFYGTTRQGGTLGIGTVFKISTVLNPPVNEISLIHVVDSDVVVTIPSVAGAVYQLQYRNSMTDGVWINVAGAPVESIGGPLTLIDPGGALHPMRFYRVIIKL